MTAYSYSAMNALIYAYWYWNRVCHDGWLLKKGEAIYHGLGKSFSEIDHDKEEDCTHFISCCIGQTGGFDLPGGGLKVPSQPGETARKPPIYGMTYAPSLVDWLRRNGAVTVGQQYWIRNYARDVIASKLGPGDLIAYASKERWTSYEHVALITSGTKITCHTRARWDVDYLDVPYPYVTLLSLPMWMAPTGSKNKPFKTADLSLNPKFVYTETSENK